MLDSGWGLILDLMGIGDQNLSSSEMAFRAVATFIVTLALVRLGDKRMFGKGTAFDPGTTYLWSSRYP